MKTITCKQLGGPCETALRAHTADEAIRMQDAHLKAVGDELHAGALVEMKARWRHPVKAMGWYKQAKADFSALPEE